MTHCINITNITASHPGYAVVLRWQVEDVIGFTAVHTFKPKNVAGGGTRILPYETEHDALNDALALALTMTKKMQTAGVAIGGAKSVVRVKQLDAQQKRLGLWGVSEIVKYFEGRLLTGSDLNTGNDEIELLYSFFKTCPEKLQRCIIRESEAKVSQATAFGVVGAIQAVLQTLHLHRRPKVTIQGFGNVGAHVARFIKPFADVTVTDVDLARLTEAQKRLGINVVPSEDAYSHYSDIFVPCAESRVFTTARLHRLNTKVICGCTNNPFDSEETGLPIIARKRILYVPDYIVNSGGALRVEAHYYAIKRSDEEIQKLIGHPTDNGFTWNQGPEIKPVFHTLICNARNRRVN